MLFLLVLLAAPVAAWWQNGHLLIAQIASDELAGSADGRDIINSLDGMLNDTGLFFPSTGDVVRVATWSDNLHDRFGSHLFDTWHYANNPFIEPNTTASLDLPPPVGSGDDVYTTLKECNRSLAEIGDNVEEVFPRGKLFIAAFCVRWLIHVVGDAHQPLHAIEAFSNKFPGGDHGGNLCTLGVPGAPDVTSLHQLWDSAGLAYPLNFPVPLTKENQTTLANQVVALQKEWPREFFTNSSINNIDFHGWLNESYTIGKSVGYLNGTLQCGSNVTKAYVAAIAEASHERIARAGYRLAALLRKIAPRHYIRQLPLYCAEQEDAGEILHLRFDRTTFYYASAGSAILAIALLVCAFCVGRSRGKSAGSNPFAFERLP